MNMLILGIDPGLHITGYGLVRIGGHDPVLVEAGVLRMATKATLGERLFELATQLDQLLAEHSPNFLAVEQLYAHYQHPRTAILMGHARGVILAAAAKAGIETHHLPSTLVKKAITGNGHANKRQMQLAITSLCKLEKPPEPPDVADAIGIAWTLARRLTGGAGLASTALARAKLGAASVHRP